MELIKDHNIEGNPDQRRFKVLQENFEFNQKHVLEGIKERNKLDSTLRREQLAYAEECLSSSRQLATLVVPAVLDVRKELELPINEALYGRLMDGLFAKQQTDTGQFLAQVRGLMEGMTASINSS